MDISYYNIIGIIMVFFLLLYAVVWYIKFYVVHFNTYTRTVYTYLRLHTLLYIQ